MKKAKLMLGVAALSAALLGTGYAAMTDVVKIGGNVNTANFCVQFKEDLKPVSDAAQNPEAYEMMGTEAQLEGDGTDKHIISFNAENMQPDVPVTYTTTIENLSSVKAQFKGAQVLKRDGATYPNDQVLITLIFNKGQENEIKYTGTPDGIISKSGDIITLAANSEGTDDEVPVEFTVEIKDEKGNINYHEKASTGFDIEIHWGQATTK